MKVSLKIDQAKAKELLLLHVEKISFGVFVVCFLMLCYSAFTRPAYNKTPDELIAESQRIDGMIESSKWSVENAKDLQAPDLSRLAAEAVAHVDPGAYSLIPINPPISDNKARRGEPTYLPVVQPMAYGGFGGIALGSGGRQSGAGAGGMASGAGNTPSGMGMEGMKPPGGMSPQTGMEGMKGAGMPTGAAKPSGGRTAKGRSSKREPKSDPKDTASSKKVTPVDEADRPLYVAPNGSKVVGRLWACLVGAVPVQEQELAYRREFQTAAFTSAATDRPVYEDYEVERAEVNPSGDAGELQWELVDVAAAWEASDKWAGAYPELVNERYVDEILTQPLPPLVNKNFDPAKVHHPLTPLAAAAKENAAKPEATEDDSPSEPGTRGRRSRSRGKSTGPNARMGGGMAGTGMSMRGQSTKKTAKVRVAYKLCRFFDFTVGSGKSYRYRVRLVLRNPNFGIAKQYLTNHDLAATEIRFSPWSEPTPVVTIPRGDDILAGEVTPATSSKEALAKVLVRKFSSELGMEIVKEFDMKRGALANNDKADVVMPDPHDPNKAVKDTLKFESGVLLVDLSGGDDVDGVRGLRAPGRILVMGEDGQLAIHSQFSDAIEFENVEQDQARLRGSAETKSTPGAGPSNSGPDIFNLNSSDDKSSKRKRKR